MSLLNSLLRTCLELPTASMYSFIKGQLSPLGYSFREKTNHYLVAIPPNPVPGIALVAHVDTFPRLEGVQLETLGVYVYNARGLLGADDRAGVYGLLKMAAGARIKPLLIFPDQEETGGIGVKLLCDDDALAGLEPDLDLFLELDRAGVNEYVYYSHKLPEPVKRYAARYGFAEEYGSYSDVKDLTEKYAIPHLNLSIGYHKQHTRKEVLDITAMQMTLRKVAQMLETNEQPRGLRMTDAEIFEPMPRFHRRGRGWKDFEHTFASYAANYQDRESAMRLSASNELSLASELEMLGDVNDLDELDELYANQVISEEAFVTKEAELLAWRYGGEDSEVAMGSGDDEDYQLEQAS